MKKAAKLILLLVILSVVLLPALTACNDSSEGTGSRGTDRLVVYNWEEYIDTDMCDDFAAYYREITGRSIEIVYTTFDTNETMMTKVLKGDANVDLICPSEYAIEKLLLAGCLLNHRDVLADIAQQAESLGLTFDGMSSLGNGNGNIEPAVMDVIRPMFGSLEDANGNTFDMTEYMVPYFWGTLGILYNTSVVSEDELEQYGWGVLWNVQQNSELENKILMKDSVRDSYAAAVFYMYEYGLLPEGYSDYTVQQLINCTDEPILKAAEKVLTEQREHISGYEVDFGKDDMVNEIVYADLAWSGDAMYAIEEGDYDEDTDTYQLGYYVPPVASNIWYDGWVIPKTVSNKLAAMMFIDYMCQPINGARNSMEVCYSSAVAKDIIRADEETVDFLIENIYTSKDDPEYDSAKAEEYLDDYFNDEVRYPEINDKLGVMRDFGSRNEDLVNMWQRAKSGGAVAASLLYIILGLVCALALALGIYFASQALKCKPKRIKSSDKDKT